MAWSIAEVARITGVTSRTLRHYDQIGLLPPASTSPSGLRFYEQPDLLRLQRILLLRELGLGLPAIAEVLAGQTDELAALGVHREWLLAESRRLRTLADTVQNTMNSRMKEEAMSAEEMFEGFDHTKYEEEAISRWGRERVTASAKTWAAMSKEERDAMMTESAAITADLDELRREGASASDPRVQAVVERHYRWISVSWTPDAEAYVGLGQMYVEDPRFTANYDGKNGERTGLAEYLLDAMRVYAATRLG